MRTLRYAMWFFVIVAASVLGYFKKHGESPGLPIAGILTVVFGVVVVAAVIFENHYSRHQRCPGCGKMMQSANADLPPEAKDHHLLYCDRCDTIWDTTIPKSRD